MTDFCFSRPMLERVLWRAKLMDRMMERVGVNAAVAARVDRGMAWYEARTRCIGCSSEWECRDWLARAEIDVPNEPPGFCCNAGFFEPLQSRAEGTLATSSPSPSSPPSFGSMEDPHDRSITPPRPHQAVR